MQGQNLPIIRWVWHLFISLWQQPAKTGHTPVEAGCCIFKHGWAGLGQAGRGEAWPGEAGQGIKSDKKGGGMAE